MNIKKIIAWEGLIILGIVSILIMGGCATVTRLDAQTSAGLYNAMVRKPISQEKIYDYTYDDVYKAIISVLNERLGYRVSRLYTNNNIIYSSYLDASPGPLLGWAYSYLFELEKIDEKHTRVTLRASGGSGSISDKDMMDKYVKEELEYLSKK